MLKKAITRGISSFLYAVAVNVILGAVLIFAVNKPDFLPVLPEFADRFNSSVQAMLVQWLLIGLTSASFGFWSILMELERWSLLLQSVVYFILTTIVWVPVAVVCWGLGRYVQTFLGVVLSYLIAYTVSWTVQYRSCKQSVKQINQRLKELEQNE